MVTLRQRQDSMELIERRTEWAGAAVVSSLRCEIHAGGRITFRTLEVDSDLSGAGGRSASKHNLGA
jgi:hypothetical protein